jgi:anti-anti-sigma factor
MEAKLKNLGEISIVSISGSLDIEETQPFREACLKHFAAKKVIFNMEDTTFVGSTGIQPFLDTIRALNETSHLGIKVVGVKSEFKRLIMNLELNGLEIHESETAAISSYFNPKPVL